MQKITVEIRSVKLTNLTEILVALEKNFYLDYDNWVTLNLRP